MKDDLIGDIYNCKIGWMQVSKEGRKNNQDLVRLIDQQWELVIAGKEAGKLVELIQNYQMDIRTPSISSDSALLEKYALSLLFDQRYQDLSFLLQRTNQIKNQQQLANIATAGNTQQLHNLGNAVKHFLSLTAEPQLRERLKTATLQAILKILGKYFISFPYEELKTIFESTQGEIEQLGYRVQGGFVELEEERVETDCLLQKLQQLASVANKMSKFE